MLKIIRVFCDLDRASTSWDAIQSVPQKGPKLPRNPDKSKVIEATHEKLTKFNDFFIPKFTPEESAKEKIRILSVLERVGFDDAMRTYAQAVIQNKYVSKEVVIAGMRIMKSEMSIMVETMETADRMTIEDQKELTFALLGGEFVLRDMIGAMPETVVEIPTNSEGTEIRKVSGTTLMNWMPDVFKKLTR